MCWPVHAHEQPLYYLATSRLYAQLCQSGTPCPESQLQAQTYKHTHNRNITLDVIHPTGFELCKRRFGDPRGVHGKKFGGLWCSATIRVVLLSRRPLTSGNLRTFSLMTKPGTNIKSGQPKFIPCALLVPETGISPRLVLGLI